MKSLLDGSDNHQPSGPQGIDRVVCTLAGQEDISMTRVSLKLPPAAARAETEAFWARQPAVKAERATALALRAAPHLAAPRGLTGSPKGLTRIEVLPTAEQAQCDGGTGRVRVKRIVRAVREPHG